MKSGLACILWTAVRYRNEGLPKRGELIVTAVVDKEAIDRGTYARIRNGLTNGLDFVMISEASDSNVVTAHRGRAVFAVTVHGRTAHSHWPDHGTNAIEKALTLLNALPRLHNPSHPKLRIEGEQEQVMLVPDRCRLIIDRCLVLGYVQRKLLQTSSR